MAQWDLEPDRYLDDAEVRRLCGDLERRARDGRARGLARPVRDWLVVDLLLSAGLRAKELAELNCGEVFLEGEKAFLRVRVGKRRARRKKLSEILRREPTPPNPRIVDLDAEIAAHLQEYLAWKSEAGEPLGAEDPLVYSSRRKGAFSVSGLERLFKRVARQARLPSVYSIHCLRHTYAGLLYRAADHDLLYVQRQLGHTTVRTTEVYARAFDPRREEIKRKFSALLRGSGALKATNQGASGESEPRPPTSDVREDKKRGRREAPPRSDQIAQEDENAPR